MERRHVLFILSLFPLIASGASKGASEGASGAAEREPLEIEGADGRRHAFEVEIADTPDERSRGLMFRRSLDRDAGMLFLYPRPRNISMWMKNTFIPLDMLFIRADGVIERIVENTVPQSLESIDAGAPVIAVLELAGGTSRILGLTAGQSVHHRAFRPAD